MSRIALFLALAAVAASLVWAYPRLPPRVASHFNAAGNPDAEMSRESHIALMAAVGMGLPLALVCIFYSIRWLPTSIVNMPNRQYWLAPERRAETSNRMLQFGLWLATLEALLLLGIHLLVVAANRAQPVRLSMAV
jgi:serine/threonine-protein kinase